MNTTPIPTTFPSDLVEELLDLMAGSGNEPSDELLDKLSDASGCTKQDLRTKLHEKRSLIADSDSEKYGASGGPIRG
jgi:hypothetical protein